MLLNVYIYIYIYILAKQLPTVAYSSTPGDAAFVGGKKNLPQGHEDSDYVLSFEIRQREGGFDSARTDRHAWKIW